MTTYYGVTHSHTGADNNHGSDNSKPRDVFAAAKRAGYDFWMLTEHSGPLGPRTDQASYYAMEQHEASAATSSSFVGMAGYEYTELGNDGDSDSGHITGFATQEFVNASAPGQTFAKLYAYVGAQRAAGRGALLGFNHPGQNGHGGSATNLRNATSREAVVMSETHNATGQGDAGHYAGFVRELDRGWRVAPTCGRDSHSLSAIPRGCTTGVLSPTLNRAGLVNAFRERRIFSTWDQNLDVRYTANGHWMGSKIGTPSSVAFDINVKDPDTTIASDRIRRIQIITAGGAVAATRDFNSHSVRWQPTVQSNSHKYFFVRVVNGEPAPHTAVAAPVWLE